jgi:hypothetical protein
MSSPFDTPGAELRYAVGWYTPFGAKLNKIPPEYREQAKSIRLFGDPQPVTHPNPGRALWLLHQVIQNNSLLNVKLLCGSPEALFVVEVTPTYPELGDRRWCAVHRRKFELSPSILPEPPLNPVALPEKYQSPELPAQAVAQEISDAVESIESHFVNGDEVDDLRHRVLTGHWTLDQCRSHVIYQILFLRWHLCKSSAECNPERFFLTFLKEEFEDSLYSELHPSLRLGPA